MIGLPPSTRVWLVAGVTDMRNYAECSVMLRPQESAPQWHAISRPCCAALGSVSLHNLASLKPPKGLEERRYGQQEEIAQSARRHGRR